MKLADRLQGVSESATLKLNARVQALKQAGETIINLSAGEPDFSAPEEAKLAIEAALKANRSKYTPVPGIPELRQKIIEKTHRQQPQVAATQPWKPSDVIVTNGGKQALFNLFFALLNPGDEVLIPAPYWLSYPEMAKLVQAKPVIVSTSLESGYKLTPELLKKAITPETRLIVFNSPSNPTGALYSHSEYEALGKVLKEHSNLWVVSDEIYDEIVFEKPFVSFLGAVPELRDRTVTVNGLSKSGAMTGWRIGWSVAPKELTQGMLTLQGQCTSGINALAQAAAVAVLDLPRDKFLAQAKIYQRRRDLALEVLSKSSKLKVRAPEGAFYLFVQIGTDAMDFAERFLEAKKVAVVPGTPFGETQSIRLSFATDDDSLRQGCQRLVDYV